MSREKFRNRFLPFIESDECNVVFPMIALASFGHLAKKTHVDAILHLLQKLQQVE